MPVLRSTDASASDAPDFIYKRYRLSDEKWWAESASRRTLLLQPA